MMTSLSLQEIDAPADRIRLHLQASRDKVIVVEGTSDADFLGEFLTQRSIFPVGSRGNVLSVAGELLVSGILGFVAVIDADFEALPEGQGWDVVLYPYQGRDLEGMLIGLGGLHHLLRFKGSTSKIEAYGGMDALVETLLSAVLPVTRLRSENARRQWGLRFDHVALHDKMDSRNLRLSVDSYCIALVCASDTDADKAQVIAIAKDESFNPGDPRGKDVLAAASCALRRVAGTLAKAACEPGLLSGDLLAGSSLLLKNSDWFVGLVDRLKTA